MVSRRGFLQGMLALAAAPAIVKAENLMKVVVPPEKKIILGRGLTEPYNIYDEAAFFSQEVSHRALSIKHLEADYDGDVVNMVKTEGGILVNRYPILGNANKGAFVHELSPLGQKLIAKLQGRSSGNITMFQGELL